MARIPLLTADSDVEPAVRDVLHGVEEMGLERFMNQFRALAHHPALAQAFQGVLRAYYFESAVPKKYLELAILMVSHLNRCHYCVVHHTPPALENGVSRGQVEAIEDGSWRGSGIFDGPELVVLTYAEQMSARAGRVEESVFQALRETFDERQIVELTVRIGMCEFFNRFNEALRLDIEPVAQALYAETTR